MIEPSRPVARIAAAMAFAVAVAACHDASAPKPLTSAERFDAVWHTVDSVYPYFVQKQIDWDTAREQFRPQAAAAPDDAAFREVVKSLLALLHDAHVSLISPEGIQTPTHALTAPPNWNRDVLTTYLARGDFHQVNGSWGYGTIDGVGYVMIGQWTDAFNVDQFDAALEQLRALPAIIVDVRMNPGGNDNLAYMVASRFADMTRVAEWFQFRSGPMRDALTPMQSRTISPRGAWQFSSKPVFVLSGRGAASSTESFVAAMRELPQVSVVGDTSAGSSGNPASFDLGYGWRYTVSRWIAYTADKQIVEDHGIAPDIYVPWAASDWSGGHDATLERAIALALGK